MRTTRVLIPLLLFAAVTSACSSSDGDDTEAATTSTETSVPAPSATEAPSNTGSTAEPDAPTPSTSTEEAATAFDYLDILLEPSDLPEGYEVSTAAGLSSFDGNALKPCGVDLAEGQFPSTTAHAWYQYPGETLGWPPDGVVWQLLTYAYDSKGTDLVAALREATRGDCIMNTDPVLGAREGAARPMEVVEHPEVNTGSYLYLPTENSDGAGTLVTQLQSGDHAVTLIMVGLAPDLLDLPDVAAPVISAAQSKLAAAAR